MRRRCGSAVPAEAVQDAWFGCGGATARWSRRSWVLDRTARRRVQQGLQSAGFDPGGADGLFGPRTRAAIGAGSRHGARVPTGYLDGPAVEALRSAGASGPAAAAVAPAAPPAPPAAAPAGSAELEGLFWQSIMNSTNPAEFEAYLAQFPNGVFSALAQARLAALRAPPAAASGATGTRVGSTVAPASGSRVAGARVSGTAAPAFGTAAGGAARRRPGEVFRDCKACPEMVVLPGGRSGAGSLRGDGGRIPGVRVGDGRRRGRRMSYVG